MVPFGRTTGALLAGVACLGAAALAVQPPHSAAVDNASCMSNLKQMALGTLMYLQDYNERYPPMRTPAHLQNRIMPYVKNRAVFTCPATGRPYVPNATLGYHQMRDVRSPAQMPMIRDAKPHADGMWTVAYADGHVKRVRALPSAAPLPPVRPATRARAGKAGARGHRRG